MDLEKVKAVVKRKPMLFLAVSLSYLVLMSLLKWGIAPTWGTLTFVLGGLLGVYFLDLAEVFFALEPSPFRSVVFTVAFVLVTFFIVTSSGSTIASGLVLSLYLSLVLWQAGQWQMTGNLNSWYQMIAVPVSTKVQWWGLLVFIALFAVASFLFVR